MFQITIKTITILCKIWHFVRIDEYTNEAIKIRESSTA